jgi:hypothetical protein
MSSVGHARMEAAEPATMLDRILSAELSGVPASRASGYYSSIVRLKHHNTLYSQGMAPQSPRAEC